MYITEAGWCGTMPHVHELGWIALATEKPPPHFPGFGTADGVAARPELRGDAGVDGVAINLTKAPALDLLSKLTTELEVQAMIIDGPGSVGLY